MDTNEGHEMDEKTEAEMSPCGMGEAKSLPIEDGGGTSIPEEEPSPEQSVGGDEPPDEEGGEDKAAQAEESDREGPDREEAVLIVPMLNELMEAIKEVGEELREVKDELKEVKLVIEKDKERESGESCSSEGLSGADDEHAGGISRDIEALSLKIDSLGKLFAQKIQNDDRERKIADNMHEELQKYKQGMYSSIMKPLIHEIIRLREDMAKVSVDFSERPDDGRNIPPDTFNGFVTQVETILENYDVSVYKSEPGDDFVPLKQRATARIATGDPSMDKKIAKSYGSGYAMDDKPIFAEKVAVFVYEKTPEKPGE